MLVLIVFLFLLMFQEKSITWDDAFQHFACLYLRYLSIYRKLEDCYDQMIHPQKRQDLKFILEVVMARLCQVKAQCVKFGPDGRATDYLNLENYLLDLKLDPSALEVPIPHYFREKNDDDDANKKRDVLEKCLEEHGMLGGIDTDVSYTSYIPKLTKDQAIRLIQKNERGRQGNVRAKLMKELRDEDNMRKKLTNSSAAGNGQSHPTYAATLIQKTFRGHYVRMKIQKQTQDELIFLGMKSLALNQRRAPIVATEGGATTSMNPVTGAGPSVGGVGAGAGASLGGVAKPTKYDPLTKEAQIRAQRKTRQIEHELKYIESLVELQKNVTEIEGPEMKDAMWEERYQWWIDQKAKTGKYPDNFNQFYRDRGETDGLPELKKKKKKKTSEDAGLSASEKAAAKAQKEKEKAAQTARENTKQGQKKMEEERKAKLALSLKTLVGPTHLINHMLECLDKYRNVWSVLDESENFQQHHDDNLAKEKLRPLIREKIKKEVDIRLLSYLDNIRLKVAQRAAAKKAAKKKGKGKKGSSKKKKDGASSSRKSGEGNGDGADGDGASGGGGDGTSRSTGGGGSTSAKKKKGGGKKGSKKKKVKKCCEGEKACAHMPLGDMISLLVKMGILQELRKPHKTMADLKGDLHWLGSEYVQANVSLDPSMQQIRSVLTETYILPLGSPYVKEQAPLVNTLLLYGPHGSGKTLLSKAIAAETVRQKTQHEKENGNLQHRSIVQACAVGDQCGSHYWLLLSLLLLPFCFFFPRTLAGSISRLETSSVSLVQRLRLQSWSIWYSRLRANYSRVSFISMKSKRFS